MAVARQLSMVAETTGVSRATNNRGFRFFLSCDVNLSPLTATEGTHTCPYPYRPQMPTLFSLALFLIIYDEILKWASRKNKCGEIKLLKRLVNLHSGFLTRLRSSVFSFQHH
jgi:hypothetical protein